MAMVNIQILMDQLRQYDAIRDDDGVLTDTVDRIQPQYVAEWPTQLHPAVRRVLEDEIPRPYQHQAAAVSYSLDGEDIVLESPTASGKTLSFTAPILDCLVRERGAHALLINPTKALAFDQRQQIDPLCRKLGIESWLFNADVEHEHKKLLKQNPPGILITNVEYLNASFLGWRDQWDKFLRKLRYIVIDEMHEYRGYFGSNVALLLRRLFRYLHSIDVNPRVILATATCANPKEHAENLIGRKVKEISVQNAFRPQRHFIFIDPKIRDFKFREILQRRVVQTAKALVKSDLQALVFCPAKTFVENAFRSCERDLKELEWDSERISLFHADMTTDKRQEIQQSMRQGEINVIFTTNALELGLNIGKLDGVVLAGFPPSLMSAWQQIGRAGRSWDQDAFVLFFAMNDPIDRFFVNNLYEFVDKPLDELVVDPSNEELINKHLPSLIEECGGSHCLNFNDEEILGRAFFQMAKQRSATPIPGYRPQPLLQLRGGIGQSFELKKGNKILGQISSTRRFREAYIGAIFTFMGRKYRVHAHEENAVVLKDTEQHFTTEPGFFTVLTTSNIYDGYGFGDIEIFLGSLQVAFNFTGFKKRDERSGDIVEKRDTPLAQFQSDLHGVWITFRNRQNVSRGIGALEHMLRVGTMFIVPADRFDTSTFSKDESVYCYENYSGGIGVAKKIFKVWYKVLGKGIQVAENCPCIKGCQNCIEPAKSYSMSNSEIDKIHGIELAREIIASTSGQADRKFDNGLWIPIC